MDKGILVVGGSWFVGIGIQGSAMDMCMGFLLLASIVRKHGLRLGPTNRPKSARTKRSSLPQFENAAADIAAETRFQCRFVESDVLVERPSIIYV